MYSRVLVPLDGSEAAESSLDKVRELAASGLIGSVVLLRVLTFNPLAVGSYSAIGGVAWPDVLTELEQWDEEEATKYLNALKAKLNLEGISTDSNIVRGAAAKAILDYANTHNVDLIIMTTREHPPFLDRLLGGVASEVMSRSPVPVLIVPARGKALVY